MNVLIKALINFNLLFFKINEENKFNFIFLMNSENKNGQNSKCDNLLPIMKFNSIDESEKNEFELSNNYLENNNNKSDNCFNNNNLKFWLFIIILNIFLIIIIIIICLNLNKYEYEYKEDVNQYTFELLYYTDKDNETIRLFEYTFTQNISKMKINNETINPCERYFFENKGNHKVYLYIKKNEMKHMAFMFGDVKNLKSVLHFILILILIL